MHVSDLYFMTYSIVYKLEIWNQTNTQHNIKIIAVSTTPAANFATSFASVVDSCRKFATGVNDTGGKKLSIC
jgi:hypothetical protein